MLRRGAPDPRGRVSQKPTHTTTGGLLPSRSRRMGGARLRARTLPASCAILVKAWTTDPAALAS